MMNPSNPIQSNQSKKFKVMPSLIQFSMPAHDLHLMHILLTPILDNWLRIKHFIPSLHSILMIMSSKSKSSEILTRDMI